MKRIICLTLISLVLSAFAGAANQVTVTFADNIIQDTLAAGMWGRFEIAIENDAPLGGISLGFIISGTASFHFVEAGGFPTNPPGPNFLEGIPGSRWMSGDSPDGSCWDLGGTHVTCDPEGSQPYQFLFGGAAQTAGLAPGQLQPMLKVNFVADCWTSDYDPRVLCIDSMEYQPAGDFVFTPGGTPAFYVTNGVNGCFPVSNRCCGCFCPEWDVGNPSTMTVAKGDTGQVTLSATDIYDPEDPILYYLVGMTGGAGTATVGLNDGIVTYIPDPTDGSETVHIDVEATKAVHGQGFCEGYAWRVNVTVTNNPPIINCGRLYNNWAAPPNVMTKTDITVEDADSYDDHVFHIMYVNPSPVGTYHIDSTTGVFTFTPEFGDGMNTYHVAIEVTDGIDSDDCTFGISVVGEQDCLAGDANLDWEVNVADAVFLVAYIFKGGPAPQVMNLADANADCDVNVADAVYLINYIFRGGPEPQIGCYYQ